MTAIVTTFPVSIVTATATATTTITNTTTLTLDYPITTLTNHLTLSQTSPSANTVTLPQISFSASTSLLATTVSATAIVDTGIATATVTTTLTSSYGAISTLLVTVSTSYWVSRAVPRKLAESPPFLPASPYLLLHFPGPFAVATNETDLATCFIEQQQQPVADHGCHLLRMLTHAGRAWRWKSHVVLTDSSRSIL